MLNHECSVICHARRRRTCRRTSCYNAQSNHITTSSNHTTDFTSTTQLDIRLSHTPAHVSPRAPRASVPRATGPARRSDKTSPNDQDHAHACASYNGANKLRYMCRLPFTLLPPALSTCPHLCHSNAACLRLQAVARPDLPGHAPLRTGAPVHAPLPTGAPVHAPLPTGAPVCMHRYAPEPELAGRGQSELGMPSVVCPVACEMRSALSPPRGSA